MSDIDAFLDALWLEQGASDHTLAAYRRDLEAWQHHLESAGDTLFSPAPERCPAWFEARRAAGYQARSNARLLSSLRSFYRWAQLDGRVEHDPLVDMALPVVRPNLPDTLEEEEVERLLAAPDVATPLGLRDRAMLELLYACGLRVSELVGLATDAVNLRQGVVRVRGKGDKDRLV
ncbi:site-specific integrase, partial [Halomonas sp. 707D4]